MNNAAAQDGAIFMLLVNAAERGEKCPSNWDIADAAGTISLSSAQTILKRLEKRGLIEIRAGQMSRVITICGTGKKTAGEITRPHWRTQPENAHKLKKNYSAPKPAPKPIASFEALNPVERDPCPRCGIRGDLGCKHSTKTLSTAVMSV